MSPRVLLVPHLNADDMRDAMSRALLDVPWTLHLDHVTGLRARSLADVAKRVDVPVDTVLYGLNRRQVGHVHCVEVQNLSVFKWPIHFVIITGRDSLEESIREIEVMAVMGS